MIRKYGKPITMRAIKRDMDEIQNMIHESRENAEKRDLSDRNKRYECIVCGFGEIKPFLTVYKKYTYLECASCNALMMEKFPDVKTMYTSEKTVNGTLYIDGVTYENRINMISKPKADFIIDVIHHLEKPIKSWLDIGCGGGELLQCLKLKDNGIRGIGLESDEAECIFAKEHGLDVRKKFIDTDNEDQEITKILQSVDVVSFLNVLEHIEKPKEYIRYLYKSMKQGAFLVLEVPRHPSIASFANMTSEDNIYRHIVPPIHLQIFSEKSLRILLEGQFEIIATWEFGQGFMDMVNNAMILSETKQCGLFEQITEAQNDIQQAVDKAGLADQIMVIAQRKE